MLLVILIILVVIFFALKKKRKNNIANRIVIGIFTLFLLFHLTMILSMFSYLEKCRNIDVEIATLQSQKSQIEERINSTINADDKEIYIQAFKGYEREKLAEIEENLSSKEKDKKALEKIRFWLLFKKEPNNVKLEEVEQKSSLENEEEVDSTEVDEIILSTDQMRGNTIIPGPYLGIQTMNIKYKTVNNEIFNGVYIVEVMAYSPAEEAGIKKGGIIISIDDKNISSNIELINEIKWSHKKGDKIHLKILSQKQEEVFEVRLEEDNEISLPQNVSFIFDVSK